MMDDGEIYGQGCKAANGGIPSEARDPVFFRSPITDHRSPNTEQKKAGTPKGVPASAFNPKKKDYLRIFKVIRWVLSRRSI